jgi:molecular chaperone GrpE
MSKKNAEKVETGNKEPDYKDLYMRTVADFQNYKRRIEQERMGWMRAAQGETVNSLLPIIDDLNRAISFCDKKSDSKVLEGLELMRKNIDKTFYDLGVTEIDCSGEFNPDFHEALVQVDSKDHKSGEIVEVISKGYTLNDYVLRHAKVSVAK